MAESNRTKNLRAKFSRNFLKFLLRQHFFRHARVASLTSPAWKGQFVTSRVKTTTTTNCRGRPKSQSRPSRRRRYSFSFSVVVQFLSSERSSSSSSSGRNLYSSEFIFSPVWLQNFFNLSTTLPST